MSGLSHSFGRFGSQWLTEIRPYKKINKILHFGIWIFYFSQTEDAPEAQLAVTSPQITTLRMASFITVPRDIAEFQGREQGELRRKGEVTIVADPGIGGRSYDPSSLFFPSLTSLPCHEVAPLNPANVSGEHYKPPAVLD